MMTSPVTALYQMLAHLADAEAILLEPQMYFNQALLGIAYRADGIAVAAYDSAKCILALQEQNGWDYDEAQEWFEFNIEGAYAGPASPMFIEVYILDGE